MDNVKLINYIRNGYTAAEMASTLGIHDLDLYQHINKLENCGYALSKNFYSDGYFKYTFKGADNSNDETINIITRPDEDEVRILCLSDLHYTSQFENRNMIHRAYDYARRNNIKIIFLCGDILQGTFGYGENSFKSGIDQINEFLNDFPFDNDVLIIAVGGDHDESLYHKEYINPIDVITKTRHNIIIPNYKYVSLKIKDLNIVLKHVQSESREAGYQTVKVKAPENYDMIINGHYHHYEFVDYISKIILTLPTSSNIHSSMNGFVDLKLYSSDNHVNRVTSDFITYINGEEVKLVTNDGRICIKEKNVDNVEEFNHRVINNPFKPTLNKDESEIIDELENEVSDLKEQLSVVNIDSNRLKSEKNDLIEENKELSSTIEILESDKTNLESTLKTVKYEKEKKDSKIENLEKENKRVLSSNKQLTANNKELKRSNIDLRNKNEELIKELKDAKELLKEYENCTKIVEQPKEETNEELTKIVEETAKAMIIAKKNENLTQEEIIEFKNKQINNISKFLKENPNLFEEETKRNEESENTNESKNEMTYEELTYEELMKNEEFNDIMCDVMDNITMEMSEKEEKQRTLKENKSYKKGKRIMNSQKSKRERTEDLIKKASKKQ